MSVPEVKLKSGAGDQMEDVRAALCRHGSPLSVRRKVHACSALSAVRLPPPAFSSFSHCHYYLPAMECFPLSFPSPDPLFM